MMWSVQISFGMLIVCVANAGSGSLQLVQQKIFAKD